MQVAAVFSCRRARAVSFASADGNVASPLSVVAATRTNISGSFISIGQELVNPKGKQAESRFQIL